QTAGAEIVADNRTGSPEAGHTVAQCCAINLIVKQLLFLGGAAAKCPFATGIGESVVCRKLVAGLIPAAGPKPGVPIGVFKSESVEHLDAGIPARMQPANAEFRRKGIVAVAGRSNESVASFKGVTLSTRS